MFSYHPIRPAIFLGIVGRKVAVFSNGQAEGVLDSRLVREFDAYLTGWDDTWRDGMKGL